MILYPHPFPGAASADVRGPESIAVRQRDPGFRDLHPAPNDLCSPGDVGEGRPAASSSALRGDPLPPPAAAHLQPHNPGQRPSRSRSVPVLAGEPGSIPTGAASSLDPVLQPMHCPGITSSSGAGGRKVKQFCCVQPCAKCRGIVSAAVGGSTPAGSGDCSLPGPGPGFLGTFQCHRLGPDGRAPCHSGLLLAACPATAPALMHAP